MGCDAYGREGNLVKDASTGPVTDALFELVGSQAQVWIHSALLNLGLLDHKSHNGISRKAE